MKNLMIIGWVATLILAGQPACAQQRYQLTSSKVHFFSEAPLENIEAMNEKSLGIVDFDSREFAFRIPIKSFIFEKELMQEHFNENYMESEKYPYAVYTGKFDGEVTFHKNGTYPVKTKGVLEIHGVKQQREIPATVSINDGRLSLSSAFDVKLEDHSIEIPTIVFNKIAEVIAVDIAGKLEVK